MIKNVIVLLIVSAMIMPAYAQSEGEGDMRSQWELTVDVIKSKARDLLAKNNEITSQNEALRSQIATLEESIKDQSSKNEEIQKFLKYRNGRNDGQIKLDEANAQIRAEKTRLNALEKELNLSRKQVMDAERKIKLKQLKLAEAQLKQSADEVKQNLNKALKPSVIEDTQLSDLRKQLEEAKTQEVLLESQLDQVKNSDQQVQLNSRAIEEEIRSLEMKLDEKRTELSQRQANATSEVRVEEYRKLQAKKLLLEGQIRDFEIKIDRLKDPANFSMSWPAQKKKLVHEMVQKDARNNELRQRIKDLREDVGVLRDQIGKLERRLNFMNDTKPMR